MSGMPISSDVIERDNARRAAPLAEDYDALGHRLARRDVDLDAVKRKVAALNLALPSWGVGTGGTRFARFPGPGEPRGIFEKLDDCAVVHQLGRATPTVSLHIPWDKADPADLRAKAASLGLGFDAMNSNTFQDHPTDPRQPLSYKFGSLSHADAAVREQAVAHNIECIEIGLRHRLRSPHGLDRRRIELSRPEPPDPKFRALPRRDGPDLRGAAGELAVVL